MRQLLRNMYLKHELWSRDKQSKLVRCAQLQHCCLD